MAFVVGEEKKRLKWGQGCDTLRTSVGKRELESMHVSMRAYVCVCAHVRMFAIMCMYSMPNQSPPHLQPALRVM